MAMPRMLPSHLDAEAPESEKNVFAAFERQLPKDWTVFHSRRIVLPRLAPWSSASSTSSSSILPGEHAGSSAAASVRGGGAGAACLGSAGVCGTGVMWAGAEACRPKLRPVGVVTSPRDLRVLRAHRPR